MQIFPEITDVTKCIMCTGEETGIPMGPDESDYSRASCLLCIRYYHQGRLFLNNVG